MANSYIFGQGTPWSYEQLQNKRKVAEQLMQGMSRAPRNVGEGLNAIGDALLVRQINKKAAAEEQRMREEAQTAFSGLMGGQPGLDALMAAAGNPMLMSNPGQAKIVETLIGRAFAEPKPQFRMLSDEEEAAMGLPPEGAWGLGPDNRPELIFEPKAPEPADPLADLRLEAERLGLENEIAGLSGERPPEADFEGEASLRKEFNALPGVKEFETQAEAYDKLQRAAIRNEGEDSPAGDIALVFSFMKVLDPQSTVREGEFQTAAAAGSFGQRIAGWVRQIQSGERLTEEQRMNMLAEATGQFQAGEQRFRTVYDRYRQIAGDQDMNIDRTVIDRRPTAPLTSPRPQPRTGTAMRASGALPTPQVTARPQQGGKLDVMTAPLGDLEGMTDQDLMDLSDEELAIVRQRLIEGS